MYTKESSTNTRNYRSFDGHSALGRHRPSASNRGLTGYVVPSLELRPIGTGMNSQPLLTCARSGGRH